MTSTYELTRRLGVTYRQLDHWVTRGWLQPEDPNPGSGVPRQWTNGELAVARRMAQLVKAGIPPALAADIARKGDEVWLSPRVRLTIVP